MTSSTSASSVAVLDACRALHAAVHDPPRFVQTLPVFSASLFGLDGKAWLDEPAEDAARDAVASVVGAGAEPTPRSLSWRASSKFWMHCARQGAGSHSAQSLHWPPHKTLFAYGPSISLTLAL